MEPWFGNHGNEFSRGVEWHYQCASMEPWFGNHGNRNESQSGHSHRQSFNGAVVR